jgi:U3 small nucleolar RNA-associated protein 5
MKNPVHSLYRSGIDGISSTEFALAADMDRYISIHDLNQKRLVRTLIAGAGVLSADFLSTKSEGADTWDSQMLAVVTNDGLVELFLRPFVPPLSRNGDIKMQRKGLTQKADAKVKLINSGNKSKPTPVASASLQGPELVVATVDGGVDISFQRISWQDEGTGELLFDGTKEVARVKAASSLNSANTNGVKSASNSHVDESKTVVVNGIDDPEGQDASQDNAIEISSSDEEEADASDGDEEKSAAPDAEVASSDDDSDEEMQDARENLDDSVLEDGEEKPSAGQLSFGELLASRTSQTIDIADAVDSSSTAVATVANGALSLPTGMSLGTVLTQSLRTNDRNLLEACLHTADLDVVRNTIQRLESSLAGILLSKLAERLSSRPGRYGNLQVWVQQLCIAHGAAISTQPAVKRQVQLLYRVLDQRTKSLSHLMLLKGKLDMLDAQLKFRKQLAAQRALRQDRDGEPGMIYIEGEADNWSSDDELDETAGTSSRQARVKAPKGKGKALEEFADQEDSEDEDMPMTNGISGSDSEEDEEDEEDEELQLQSGTLVDDEAADEEDSDGEGDDVDSEEEEDSEEEDSEMDDFIDDNTPEVEDASEDVSVHGKDGEDEEDEEETPQKPPTKKSKHR